MNFTFKSLWNEYEINGKEVTKEEFDRLLSKWCGEKPNEQPI